VSKRKNGEESPTTDAPPAEEAGLAGVDAAPREPLTRDQIEDLRRELLALLEAQGVVADDPRGGRFDPERHQALVHETAPGHEEGTVVEVFGKGYSYKDRLLRPALVKVAKGDDDDNSGGDRGAIH
jgi:molecular chaperone GrpE